MRQFLSSHWIFVFPWALLVTNLVLKGIFLTSEDITPGEAFTIYHAQFNVNVMIGHLKALNVMPFYSILLHFWIKLFGISPLAVRSLPLIIAGFCPSLLYWISRRYFSNYVCVTAALLFSGSALLLNYAHESSSLALSALLAMVSARFYLDLFSGNGNTMRTALLVIANSALVYTLYSGWLIVLMQCLHFLFYRKQLIKFSLVMAALLLIYWPWLIVIFHFFFLPDTPVGPALPALESLYNWIWALCNQPVITMAAIGIFVTGAVLFIARPKFLSLRPQPVFVLGWFGIPYLGLFLASFSLPVYNSGDLMVAAPGFYLLLAISLETISKKVWLAAALVLSFAFTHFLDSRKSPPVKQLVNHVRSAKKPQTVVLGSPYSLMLPFSYYYNPDYFSAVNDHLRNHLTDSLLRAENIYFIKDPGEYSSFLLRKSPVIVVADTKGGDHALIESLASHYASRKVVNLHNTYLLYYMEDPADVK